MRAASTRKAIVVKKFGGTSVGSIERIRQVAKLVTTFARENPGTGVVVVASAISGETDRLLTLGKSCVKSPSKRELDQISATGEQVSIGLLAMAIQECGFPSRSFLGFQAGVITNAEFGSAQIERIDPIRIERSLAAGEIPVVAGFQGMTEAGEITTLGRGGSDISGVAIAAALNARACYIYTDVEGVFSADPRIVRRPRMLAQIAHEEMLELASQGAKVLHPRSVDFALRYQVPLVTLSTFKPGPGTWIVQEDELMEKAAVSGITHRSDEAKLTISKLPGGTRGVSTVFSALAKAGIFVDMITQTGVTDTDATANLCFTVPDESSSRALSLMQSLVPSLGAEGASLDRDISKISIVGVGMRSHAGIAAKMFSVLAHEEIEVGMISTSEIKISVIVPRKCSEHAVRALHHAFIEMAPEVSTERDAPLFVGERPLASQVTATAAG